MATPLTKGSVARLPWWRRSDGARSGAEQTRERSDERVFVDVSGADGDIESTADMRGGEDGGDAPSERAADHIEAGADTAQDEVSDDQVEALARERP